MAERKFQMVDRYDPGESPAWEVEVYGEIVGLVEEHDTADGVRYAAVDYMRPAQMEWFGSKQQAVVFATASAEEV